MTSPRGLPGYGGKLSITDPRTVLAPGSEAEVTQGTDPWLVEVTNATTDDLLRIIAEDLHDLKQLFILRLAGGS